MKSAILLLGAALALAACRTSFKDVQKKHHDAIEAKLAQVTRIGKLLELTPPLYRDDASIQIPAAPAAAKAWPLGMAGHVALMYQEAFADLTAQVPAVARQPFANVLNVCASLLRKGECPGGCTSLECGCARFQAEDHLERCEAVQVLLVVRTLEFGLPQAVAHTTPDLSVPDRGREARAVDARHPDASHGGDARAPERLDGGTRDRPPPDTRRAPDLRLESWTFRGGLLRAEVHVYELATGRRLGGFRVRAESSPKIHKTTYLNQTVTRAEAQGYVENEFLESCRIALGAEIRRRVPGAYRY
jgi:hypothetical protein